jgi:hypothetical protein
MAGSEMGFNPGSRLGREKAFQIVLEASGGDMGFLPAPSFSGGQPTLGPCSQRLPDGRFLDDSLQEGRTRFQLRELGKVGVEEAPLLGLALT